MNKRNLESREVRLGLIHVAGLLGLTVGCIAAAFCLGYLAGSKVGFERESNTILAELPKFPVGGEGAGDDAGEKIANEVYAKLNEQSNNTSLGDNSGEDGEGTGRTDSSKVPELASIPDVRPEGIPKDSVAVEEEEGIGVKGDTGSAHAGDIKVIDTRKTPARPDANAVIGERGKTESAQPEKKGSDVQAARVADAKEPVTLGSLIPKKGDAPLESTDTQPVKVVPTKSVPQDSQKDTKSNATKSLADLNSSVPEKKPIPGGIAVSKNIPTGWFAQVAAPKRLEDASNLAQSLKRSGFAVSIESAQVRGEDYYRVLVGPETARSQAEILLKQLKREPYVKGEPFIRMVK